MFPKTEKDYEAFMLKNLNTSPVTQSGALSSWIGEHPIQSRLNQKPFWPLCVTILPMDSNCPGFVQRRPLTLAFLNHPLLQNSMCKMWLTPVINTEFSTALNTQKMFVVSKKTTKQVLCSSFFWHKNILFFVLNQTHYSQALRWWEIGLKSIIFILPLHNVLLKEFVSLHFILSLKLPLGL